MPSEITFADISYSFMHDLAECLIVEPKDIKVQIDVGYDYPTSACFKAEIDDVTHLNIDGFGFCIFPEESILPARYFSVFVIAVEGQELTVTERTRGMFKTENIPIYYYKNHKKLNIPWNFVLLVEIEDMAKPFSFLRKVVRNEKGQKETFFEIIINRGELN